MIPPIDRRSMPNERRRYHRFSTLRMAGALQGIGFPMTVCQVAGRTRISFVLEDYSLEGFAIRPMSICGGFEACSKMRLRGRETVMALPVHYIGRGTQRLEALCDCIRFHKEDERAGWQRKPVGNGANSDAWLADFWTLFRADNCAVAPDEKWAELILKSAFQKHQQKGDVGGNLRTNVGNIDLTNSCTLQEGRRFFLRLVADCLAIISSAARMRTSREKTEVAAVAAAFLAGQTLWHLDEKKSLFGEGSLSIGLSAAECLLHQPEFVSWLGRAPLNRTSAERLSMFDDRLGTGTTTLEVYQAIASYLMGLL